MANLSYLEALHGVVSDDDMEAMLGLIDGHKNWGAFRAKVPTHIIVNMADEIKRLREKVGGYKRLPDVKMEELDPPFDSE